MWAIIFDRALVQTPLCPRYSRRDFACCEILKCNSSQCVGRTCARFSKPSIAQSGRALTTTGQFSFHRLGDKTGLDRSAMNGSTRGTFTLA